MRNLRKINDWAVNLDRPVTAHTFDLDDIIYTCGPEPGDSSIVLKRLPTTSPDPSNAEEIARWDVPVGDHVLDLHHSAASGSMSLIFDGGDIVTVRQDIETGTTIEIVGSIDAGICAVSWSPDEELVAIATKANTLLLMTADFDPLANIPLSIEDLEVSSHISVGWGKKETQFKGRGVAKALRDPTVPEQIDEGSLSAYDNGQVTISWRGDGQYFAMNSVIDSNPKRRVIRVYSREGVLESVSEPVNRLEGALSWRPSGQTIAGIQRRVDGGLDVVFFERNGLRHGEFDARLNTTDRNAVDKNVNLAWNIDSTVLAIELKDRIQLWTSNNYHWYLKQEVATNPGQAVDDVDGTYPSSDSLSNTCLVSGSKLRMKWHPERPLTLAIRQAKKNIRQLSFEFTITRGPITPPNDLGLVAVIDGTKLKITPLRIANIPPPMALDELDLPTPALDVSFRDDGLGFTIQHTDRVTTWVCDYAAKPMKLAAMASVNEPYIDPDAYQTSRPFRLSEHGVLQGRGLRISGCTSYIVTTAHLIFTTSNNLLKFVHMRHEDGELQVPPDEPEKDERCRNVERGAKIVTVMPTAYALVLQMPRGNLETIYPRALVLAGIRRCISELDYRQAFEICRTHRVDMNILHDYAPEQFMASIELILNQIEKVEFVDLLLSSLTNDNVAESIYKETHISPLSPPTTNEIQPGFGPSTISHSKVNRICDAFIQSLSHMPSRNVQNTVTAYVCKIPPDLESALKLISQLRVHGKHEELEAAVDHICFLADVNQLYDTALGLYDLEVTLLIAQQSQKDPREYLPYLQRLHDLSPLRRQFAIDDDLKRCDKALMHLHALEAFDELKQYVAKHELYNASIELYRYDQTKLNELTRMFADFLSSQNRYKEAGIAYEFVQDYAAAFEIYRSGSLWQECLAAGALAQIPDNELKIVAADFAASLEEAKEFHGAATIQRDHLSNLEGAARLLCKGFDFMQAIRLAVTHRRPDLLKTIIDPGLIEASGVTTELLAEMKSQLSAQIPRIRELRQKKSENPMAFLDGGGNGDDLDIPDNMSLAPTDASTTGTFMTRYTNASNGTLATNTTRRTSKNRRREERKRARGKKGTVYEEEYLVNSVTRLIERFNSVADDVNCLVEGLMRRSMRERAVAIETSARELWNACRSCIDEVFSIDMTAGKDEKFIDGEPHQRPWGGQGVLWDALTTAEVRRDPPNLKPFEGLGLLQ